MKRFVFSGCALVSIGLATCAYGQAADETGNSHDKSTSENKLNSPSPPENMPGSWGNIRLADAPLDSSKDVEETSAWMDIALSQDADSSAATHSTQANDKNRERADRELRRVNEWSQIPASTPRAAAIPPTPTKDLTFTTPGLTQTDEKYNSLGDPHDQSRTWLARPPAYQISHDAQLRPLSGGGIFVPTMTGGQSEPKYQVYNAEGKNVKEAHTGSTAYVPAGKYTVRVGTPVSHDALEFQVNVVEGDITVVPVEWTGLIVKVVNDRGSAVRGGHIPDLIIHCPASMLCMACSRALES